MKLKYLMLIALGLVSLHTWAADNEEKEKDKKLWFGPKFGLDVVSSTSNIAGLTEQLKNNYQLGFFAQLGEKYYLKPEIYYASYTTDAVTAVKINYLKAPMMLGVRLFDIGLLSLHLNGGPSYLKQLDSDAAGVWNWEAGVGVGVLGFITTDLRYTFQKGTSSGITQIEQLINNGGMLNLTVGLRL